MKTILLSLLAAISFNAPASARLGETTAECTERYGSAVEKKGDECVFEKNGLRITVRFFEGRAAEISYSRQITSLAELAVFFSDSETTEILQRNAPGKWISVEDRKWKSESGDEATRSVGAITIRCAAAIRRDEEKARQDATGRLKGL
jgi:hypothetical protein